MAASQVWTLGEAPMTPSSGAAGVSAVVERLFFANTTSFAVIHRASDALCETINVPVR